MASYFMDKNNYVDSDLIPQDQSDILFQEALSILLEDEQPEELVSPNSSLLLKFMNNHDFKRAAIIIKEDNRPLEVCFKKLTIDIILRFFVFLVHKREKEIVLLMIENEDLVKYLKGLPVEAPEGTRVLRPVELMPLLRIALSARYRDIVKIMWDNPNLVLYCQGLEVHIDGRAEVISFDLLLQLFWSMLSYHSITRIKQLWANPQLSAYFCGERVFIEGSFRQLDLNGVFEFSKKAAYARAHCVIETLLCNQVVAHYIKGLPVEHCSNLQRLSPSKLAEIFGISV